MLRNELDFSLQNVGLKRNFWLDLQRKNNLSSNPTKVTSLALIFFSRFFEKCYVILKAQANPLYGAPDTVEGTFIVSEMYGCCDLSSRSKFSFQQKLLLGINHVRNFPVHRPHWNSISESDKLYKYVSQNNLIKLISFGY